MAEAQKKKKGLVDDTKIALFNEAEVCQDPKAEEPTEETFTTKRKAKSSDIIPQELPVSEFALPIPEEQCFCGKCGAKLTSKSKEFVRRELIMLPQAQKRLEYYQYTYSCKQCEEKQGIVRVEACVLPKPLMKNSLASPSTIADIITKKYTQGESLLKQEKAWAKQGVTLSRATMANWVVQCTQTWLKPLYRHMKQQLLEEKVIRAEVANVPTLDRDGATVSTNSRIWLYLSGAHSNKKIRIFEYQPEDSGKRPEAFLKGFSGCLLTDHASEEFAKITKATHCYGWKSVSAKWVKAISEGEATQTADDAERGYRYCTKLYALEKKYSYADANGRRAYRQNVVWSHLEEYFLWLKSLHPEKGSALEVAVTYMLSRKQQLMAFLEHGDVPIGNDLAEKEIAPFVPGNAKSWRFCDSNKGAESSIILYSLVATAQANQVEPYSYLLRVLSLLPYCDAKNLSHNQLEMFMPWHPDAKD